MSQDLPVLARNKAGEYFKQGYNCAESVFRAYLDLLPHNLPPETARLASAFGGGLGRAGCICGALTGSELVLSLLAGRENQAEKPDRIYQLSSEFHNRFKEHFGATCCRVLNKEDYQSQEHFRRCLKITGGAAQLLAQFILSHDLLDGLPLPQ
ncbi:MAG: C-GCAxxG-C-C family protein [Firmicutes bacterium]|nr:C-GCAxxG-C-C family protein [Bacillota bacterium]